MKLLVLGGTGFVGRAVVDVAAARGWDVTTFNRGRVDENRPGVEALRGDRTATDGLAALHGRSWDAVIDTWSGAPRAVLATARQLAPAVGHYGYVSSGSVYAPPVPPMATEEATLVQAAPDADDGPYDQNKAGAEVAAVQELGERALLARAGLILGPHEDVGRLPWWLLRAARGGPMLAPGPRDLPLQFIDARDLATWMLDAAQAGVAGPYNVTSPAGFTTMDELLRLVVEVTGERAELRWVDAEAVLAAGVEPWNDLPIWIPPGHEYLDVLPARDVTEALRAGLVCRPVRETVADTWAWLTSIGGTPPQRPDRPAVGLDPEVEATLLAGP